MPRKKKNIEIAEFLALNSAYTYRVDMGKFNVRYTVLALTEKSARDKIAEMHPGKSITYLSQANRIILI
jgi:hypothetical protein